VERHVGEAVVVNKRPGDHEAVEQLVGMEQDVHLAGEEPKNIKYRKISPEPNLSGILKAYSMAPAM
jgi:hypothetical protein